MPCDSHSPGYPIALSLSILSMAARYSCDSGPERRDMSRTAMVPLLRNYSTFSLPRHRVLPLGTWTKSKPPSDRIEGVTPVWRPVAALILSPNF